MEVQRPRASAIVAFAALLFALTAFLLGAAPFTPALSLAVVALPMAIYGFLSGARRTSCLAVCWAILALAAVPLADLVDGRIDHVLVALGICGLVLSVALLADYRRAAG